MREILFRGRNENSTWIYGSLLVDKDTFDKNAFIYYICDIDGYSMEIVNTKTIGQFTGMTDKNGTKIFEHDIVRIAVCGTYDNYVISYDKENARFVVGDTGFTFWSYISTKIEVIGNIHDNPELLNK